ncbi:MAG: flagellar export chaperone FliS [Candidatus Latescibacterota bacterium]|nr:flagellar export chaperone FliS [Candidatus Latescibacterota bacterium]
MNRAPLQQKYSTVQIKTANKGKLIVMLYQGAVRFMKKALLQMENKDMEGKGNSLIRAQDIILELLYALDENLIKDGNELALNLQRVYLYCYRRLVHANVHLDIKAIEEVIELLGNLLEAWEKVAESPSGDGPAGPTQSVALTG